MARRLSQGAQILNLTFHRDVAMTTGLRAVLLALLAFVMLRVAVHSASQNSLRFRKSSLEELIRETLFGPALPGSGAGSGSVLWSADMESGDLSQWNLPGVPNSPNAGGGVFNSGIAMASVDSASPAHTGRHSAKLFIETREEPQTLTSGTRLFRWQEPESHRELYYSVWYYFPRRYRPNGNPSWWNVFQWKSKHVNATASDPFFILNIGNRADGSMFAYLYNPITQASYDQTITTIPERKWFRLEAYYKCAGDRTGHVTFWQDGVQIFDIPSVQTRYADGDCAWSVNNYSNSLDPSDATIFVDDAAICLGTRCP